MNALLQWGLAPIEIAHKPLFDRYLEALAAPLSEYSFAQLYFWRESLDLRWRQICGHLCVFSASDGELSLFLPPLGDGCGERALSAVFEILDDANGRRGKRSASRIEYVSDELLGRFNRDQLEVEGFARDYVYPVVRMIDLAGGDLSSKRQARTRFMRRYDSVAERYEASRHAEDCQRLLDLWESQRGARRGGREEGYKRGKEIEGCRSVLSRTSELGLSGLVVYTKDRQPEGELHDRALSGFTLGMPLGRDQACILVEKTDLSVVGMAQFIFSEYCRVQWSDWQWVNVGDDWGLPSLAATKMSYRPVKLLAKYAVMRAALGQASATAA